MYSETYGLLMKYIICHSAKGSYCYYIGALKEYICLCVSPQM